MLATNRNYAVLLAIALSILAMLAFGACSGDDEGDPDATATVVIATGEPSSGTIDVSAVPELDDGVLTAGSNIAYAPMEFYEEGTETPAGLDIDLATAMANVLGVEVVFINVGTDGIIPALDAGDFDVIWSAMTIDATRQEQVDFVPYLMVGTGILVPAGNPNAIQGEADLCGLTTAIQIATVQETMIDDLNQTCNEPIEKLAFDTNVEAVEALATGSADANLSDYPVALLDAEDSGGELEVVEAQLSPAPYGIGTRKGSDALLEVLDQALSAIIQSGQYLQILQGWNLDSAALPQN